MKVLPPRSPERPQNSVFLNLGALCVLSGSKPFTEGRRASEVVFKRKLQHARTIQSIDHLQRAEPRLRQQVAGLPDGLPVSAIGADWLILQRVDSVAILHVIVGVVQQVKRLGFDGNALPFSDRDVARQAEIDLLCPWAIRGVQPNIGAGTAAVDAK